MTVTEPYDIVDISKKLHKKQLKGESQNTDCIRDLCNVLQSDRDRIRISCNVSKYNAK